jgi:probable F420-dependent oxidoreductase
MTTTPAPFRFGVQTYAAGSAAQWRDQALRAADLGYTSAHLPDHLGGQFSPLPALTAVATAAPGLRVGPMVLNCAVRHPVALAKELATLDVLAEGRLDVGLGVGWQSTDFVRSGTPRLDPGARVRRLMEFVAVLEALWEHGELSHEGEFFQFADAKCLPKPVQSRLPLFVGGGSPKVLGFAGRRAQTVGLDVPQPSGQFHPATFLGAASRSAFLRRAEWARVAAAEAGREITLSMQIPSGLVRLDGGSTEDIAEQWGVTSDVLADSPLSLLGDTDAVVEKLQKWRVESGVSFLVIPADAMTVAAPLVARLAGM